MDRFEMREHGGFRSKTIEAGPDDIEQNMKGDPLTKKLTKMRVSKDWSNNMPIHSSPYKFEIG